MSSSIRKRRPSIPDVPAAVSTISHTSKTINWVELPEWQKDNEYIVSGYRRVQNQWMGCFTSVFAYLHNETINIHTHLWGAVLFGYFLATFDETYLKQFTGTTWADSARYTDTALLGSFYPALHFGFFCQPRLQILYISSLSFIGLGAAYIVLNPEYAKPTHRGARTTVFVGLGLSAVGPVTHCLLTEGYHKVFSHLGFGWLVVSGALYIFGALLYANRIPERLAPGKFDYFFASHQIFHCCVVAAAGAHYAGVLTALKYSYSQPNICAGLPD
ncbi:hemolysin-III related-domain-containing protein [Mycena latifolia]|nr:hemolysin-III related-domain-containing protein [Mycena latifolia]